MLPISGYLRLPSLPALPPLLPTVTKVTLVASVCFFALRYLFDRYVLPSFSASDFSEVLYNKPKEGRASSSTTSDKPPSQEVKTPVTRPAEPASAGAGAAGAAPPPRKDSGKDSGSEQMPTQIGAMQASRRYLTTMAKSQPPTSLESKGVKRYLEHLNGAIVAWKLTPGGALGDDWLAAFRKIVAPLGRRLDKHERLLATSMALHAPFMEPFVSPPSELTQDAVLDVSRQMQEGIAHIRGQRELQARLRPMLGSSPREVFTATMRDIGAIVYMLMLVILRRSQERMTEEESARFFDRHDNLYRIALVHHYRFYYMVRHAAVVSGIYRVKLFIAKGGDQELWREQFNDIQKLLCERLHGDHIKDEHRVTDNGKVFTPPLPEFEGPLVTDLLK